jgi:hypothetical protein
MKEEWKEYKIGHDNSEAKLKELIMEKLGKEQKRVEVEHQRLSHAFGYPIGIMKTLKRDDFSPVLSILKDFKSERTEPNPYLEFIHSVLNVSLTIKRIG